jgi:hypothetical protein
VALTDALAAVKTHAAAVTGIKQSHSAPPGAITQLPAVVCFAKRGETETKSAGFAESYQTIACQVWVSVVQGDDRAHDQLMGFLEPMQIKLRDDPTLGGKVNTIFGKIRNQTYRGDWAGIKAAYLEFEIDVKMVVSAS